MGRLDELDLTLKLSREEESERLEIPEDRADAVRTSLGSIYALIDSLDELDLGETPPATAFDARWE